MAEQERRKHERIEIEMPTRMWLDEPHKGTGIMFEGFASTRDLSIGGTFLHSNYLLKVGFPLNLEMRMSDNELLVARGEIIHCVAHDDAANEPGMGVQFTEVDAENRERLLRFFVSDRIKEFYNDRFLVEFPHLEQVLSLKDVALVINLWEDKEGRIAALRHPGAASELAKKQAERQAAKLTVRRKGRD